LKSCVARNTIKPFTLWIWTCFVTLWFVFAQTLTVIIQELDHNSSSNFGRWRIAACYILLIFSFIFGLILVNETQSTCRLACLGIFVKDVMAHTKHFVRWWERSYSCSRWIDRIIDNRALPSRIDEFRCEDDSKYPPLEYDEEGNLIIEKEEMEKYKHVWCDSLKEKVSAMKD
jgi:hypothetical protein